MINLLINCQQDYHNFIFRLRKHQETCCQYLHSIENKTKTMLDMFSNVLYCTSLTVPGLWLPKVQIVNAVQIHVLCVPGKGTFPHAKVQVWCVDSFNLDPTLTLHSVQNGVEMTNVPFFDILQKTKEEVKITLMCILENISKTRNHQRCHSECSTKFYLVAVALTGSYSVPQTSAPYSGGLKVRFFQNFLSNSSKSTYRGLQNLERDMF